MIVVKVKDILDKKYLNVNILSKMTGIPPVNLYRLCNNRCCQVRFSVLDKICKALDCKIEDVLKIE